MLGDAARVLGGSVRTVRRSAVRRDVHAMPARGADVHRAPRPPLVQLDRELHHDRSDVRRRRGVTDTISRST